MIFIGVVGVIAIKVVGIFIVDRVTMMMVAVAGIYRCHYKENVNMDCVVLPRVSGLNAGTKRNWLDCLLSINKEFRKLKMPEVC
uniref:Uncharacterized protein n=1 Tax=Helianthus annuus TaxID=4232 RepID=A0A251SGS6_HELAN